MPHVNVGQHFAAHVKWITLYNDKFSAFPEFIITPSLVVSLSTKTANNDGSGVYPQNNDDNNNNENDVRGHSGPASGSRKHLQSTT